MRKQPRGPKQKSPRLVRIIDADSKNFKGMNGNMDAIVVEVERFSFGLFHQVGFCRARGSMRNFQLHRSLLARPLVYVEDLSLIHI